SALVITKGSRIELSADGLQVRLPVHETLEALLVVIVMSESGSSSQLPALPCEAAALTEAVAPIFNVPLPDVSIQPPSPPTGPPVARMLPLNVVAPSDHTATVPPLPVTVALASIKAPAEMLVE